MKTRNNGVKNKHTKTTTSFRLTYNDFEKLSTLAKIESMRLGRDVTRTDILTSLINKEYEREKQERGVNFEE